MYAEGGTEPLATLLLGGSLQLDGAVESAGLELGACPDPRIALELVALLLRSDLFGPKGYLSSQSQERDSLESGRWRFAHRLVYRGDSMDRPRLPRHNVCCSSVGKDAHRCGAESRSLSTFAGFVQDLLSLSPHLVLVGISDNRATGLLPADFFEIVAAVRRRRPEERATVGPSVDLARVAARRRCPGLGKGFLVAAGWKISTRGVSTTEFTFVAKANAVPASGPRLDQNRLQFSRPLRALAADIPFLLYTGRTRLKPFWPRPSLATVGCRRSVSESRLPTSFMDPRAVAARAGPISSQLAMLEIST